MLNSTQEVYERLIRGGFLSADSSKPEVKHLYQEVDDNYGEYADFFKKIGFNLESGNGYYFFSSMNESKSDVERRLAAFCKWIDYLDFFKTFDTTFSVGYHFSKARIVNEIDVNADLKDKAKHLSAKNMSFAELVDKIINELETMGFAEKVDDITETYKVTSAFRYAEDLVNLITIYNEDEIPQ
ncbi:MAG: hypothetical protein E7074_07045 [Bacteroidales bacterium]|jgi:hypothetical protein|nr:hypothetical protein [Bacteroidales bacterium]